VSRGFFVKARTALPAGVKEIVAVAKKADAPAKQENRFVRYFKEVRAELKKVAWPSKRTTLNLTGIVLAVTVTMSIALGVIDWLFSKLFSLIIG
jgi:preprotein translocase subunit SecE